jgi:hypothetical protein
LGISKELGEATVQVGKLKALLSSSTNSLGNLDIGAFTKNLKASG